MAKYTIRIMNQSGFTKNYVLYPKPPEVEGPGPMTVQSRAWVTCTVFNGAFDSITTEDAFQAWWDHGGPQPNGIIPVVQTTDVDLDAGDAVMFVATPAPGFAETLTGEAPADAFDIVTATDFTASSAFVLGLSQTSSKGPSPVAGFEAEPNATFTVYPTKGAFYVGTGRYEPGDPVTPPRVASQQAQIDFTGLPQTTVTVVQNPDGTWSTTYE